MFVFSRPENYLLLFQDWNITSQILPECVRLVLSTNCVRLFLYQSWQVRLLESKLHDNKRKKMEYIERAKEQEEAIQSLRSVLGDSVQQFVSNDLESPNAIDRATSKLNKSAMDLLQQHDPPSKVGSHYSPSTSASPTHSFLSPGSAVPPHSMYTSPYTSTPAKSS